MLTSAHDDSANVPERRVIDAYSMRLRQGLSSTVLAWMHQLVKSSGFNWLCFLLAWLARAGPWVDLAQVFLAAKGLLGATPPTKRRPVRTYVRIGPSP